MAKATLPALGLGTFRLKGEELMGSIHTALDLGYRHIDTAQMYDNEETVGAALDAHDVPRDEVFLTTKIWHDRLRHDDRFPGVRSIHVTPGNLTASVRFEAPVEIRGMTLDILQSIPQAVLTRLGANKDPLQLVEHPFLEGLRITRFRVDGKITRIGLKSTRKRRTLGPILADHPRAIEQGWTEMTA